MTWLRNVYLCGVGWNVFDLLIVVGSWFPGGGDVMIVIRLLRLMMVFRLVQQLPGMRLAVDALLYGFTSIGYVGIMMMLCCQYLRTKVVSVSNGSFQIPLLHKIFREVSTNSDDCGKLTNTGRSSSGGVLADTSFP